MPVDMNKLAAENPEVHAYIVELRGEAAANRVKANTAEAEVSRLKEEVQAAQTKITEWIDQQRQEKAKATEAEQRAAAAKKYGLTDAQAARLRGTTPEEFEADAAQLAKDFGIPAPTPEGNGPDTKRRPPVDPGLTGTDEDPAASAPDPEAAEFVQKLLAARGLSGSESA